MEIFNICYSEQNEEFRKNKVLRPEILRPKPQNEITTQPHDPGRHGQDYLREHKIFPDSISDGSALLERTAKEIHWC
jgi:hypothetical protein